jgi:hypothetical protein
MELMVTVLVPVLARITGCASLVDPLTVLGKDRLAGETLMEVDAAPVPVSVTFCGEPVALSATLSVPVSVPVVVGLKLTDMVHVAAAASVVPQVVVSLNELALTPLSVIPPVVMVRVEVLVFLSVTTWAALVEPTAVLAKVSVAGVSVAVGGAAAPVPVNVTFCGEPVALSATFRVPVSVPDVVGLKLTEMVHVAAAASVVPQVVVSLNELALVPLRVIPPVVMVRVEVLVFFSVTT